MVAANKNTELYQFIKAYAEAAAVSVGLPIQFIGDPEDTPVVSGRATPFLTCTIIKAKPLRLAMASAGVSQIKGSLTILLRRPLHELVDVSIQTAGDIGSQFPVDAVVSFGLPEIKNGYVDAGMWATPIVFSWETFEGADFLGSIITPISNVNGVEVKDEGVVINTRSTTLNFTGDSVTAVDSGGGETEIQISSVGAVDSVNAKTGVVVLDADDLSDAATINKFVTASDITVLGNTSGTNTGDQTIPASGVDFDPVGTDNSDNNAVNTLYSGLVTNATHTGDVTGATALTIGTNKVTLAMQSQMATASFLGRATAATGNVEVLSKAQALAVLNVEDGATAGGAVDSVNAQTGVVVLDADDISDAATTNKFVTASDVTVLGNTSNTNSGDNAANATYANDYRAANFVSGTDYEPAKGIDDNFVTDVEKVVIGNTSGTNTGDQTIPASGVDFDPVGTDNSDNNAVNTLYSGLVTNATHTGDVTGSGALTIATGAVTLAKMASIATASFLGRVTAATGNVEVLTATQARTILNVEDGATADQITVSSTAPSSPATNELWLDTT